MGDLLRWIDDETVDSAAMLSAYLWHLSRIRNGIVGPLPIVLHRQDVDEFEMPQPEGTVSKSCTKLGCARCKFGRGGYVFRWYHKAWFSKYVSMVRPGAWKEHETGFNQAEDN